MDVFKTEQGSNNFIDINEENFADATGKTHPFCQKNTAGKESYFAICPLCENPIQIIGLYKQEKDSIRPYGRHCGRSITDLPPYNRDAYLSCPWADPNANYGNKKREPDNPTGQALYELMKEQFDRIIYILQQSTGIKISRAYAEELLRFWVANECWRNYDSTFANLPFMLLYPAPSKTLVNRYVSKKSNLYGDLQGKRYIDLEETQLSNYASVKPATSKFLDLTFYLTKHKYEHEGESMKEFFTLKVRKGSRSVYSEVIEVEPNYLSNLMGLSESRSHRDSKLLEIAKGIM